MYRYRFWIGGILALVVVAGGFWAWQSSQPQSLLPSIVAKKIQGFTPYFYKQLPSGYTFDVKRVVYDNGVLMVPLTKNGQSSVVMTEQALSAGLSTQDLQQNGEGVQGTVAQAAINNVEGRLVGTMIASNDHTLVLITTTANDDMTKSDLIQLLRGLQPLR